MSRVAASLRAGPVHLAEAQLCRVKERHRRRSRVSELLNLFSLYQGTALSGSRSVHKKVLLWRGREMPAGSWLRQHRNIFSP